MSDATPMLDASTVRGGLDSLAFLVQNAHNHELPDWDEWVAAARNDRAEALAALERLEQAAIGECG